MLSKINARKDQKGFTLIEFMIVIAIIGILAAIAILQFASYRKRAYNSSAQSDVKNAATAQEAYYVDNDTYTTHGNLSLNTGDGVTLTADGGTSDYTITGYHSSGDKTYTLTGPGGSLTDS